MGGNCSQGIYQCIIVDGGNPVNRVAVKLIALKLYLKELA